MPSESPFTLVLSEDQGLVLSAVNAAARGAGIRPGMALADARAMLPMLMTRPGEPLHDGKALKALALWCGRYGPSLNTDGADGLWIDISGIAHLFGGEVGLLRDLVGRLKAFGITAHPGLADTIGAASALARFGPRRRIDERIAAPGGTRAALAELPAAALRLEPKTVQLLGRLGLKRIGQLWALPRASLKRRFARREAAEAVLLRLDQALGLAAEPGRALLPPPDHVARAAFCEPLISTEGIEAELTKLAEALAGDLAAAHAGARRLALTLYRSDGTRAVIRAGLARPGRSARHMLALLRDKLAGIDAGFGIDLMTLAARAVEPLSPEQASLTGEKPGSDGGASLLIDRLTSRLGGTSVFRLVPGDSHWPERAQSLRPALEASDRASFSTPRPLPPRPPFLIDPPEPIDVMAGLPEGPPMRFRWRRSLRTVRRAEGPERIAPEWWREIGAGLPSRPRDYYRIEDEAGGRYWVFREGLYRDGADERPPRWYLHGLYA